MMYLQLDPIPHTVFPCIYIYIYIYIYVRIYIYTTIKCEGRYHQAAGNEIAVRVLQKAQGTDLG